MGRVREGFYTNNNRTRKREYDMKNKIRLENGFSLMEMMVVLLIISIIMAATAPMVAKKMATDRANGGSPWIFTSNNGNIGFNIAGNNVSAIIGAADISGLSNNVTPRLIINGSNTQPALAFASGSAYVGQLTVDGANNAVGISNDDITNGTVALGLEQSIGNTNTIAIGNGITTTNNGEINIGGKFRYDGSENITLGNNSDVVNIPGSLQLNGLTSTGGVNYVRYTGNSHQLTLGTEYDTVYIPGNLVVDKHTILGAKGGDFAFKENQKDIYISAWRGNSTNSYALYATKKATSNNKLLELAKEYGIQNFGVDNLPISSDARLKNIGTKYTSGLEDLKKLDIYNFTFKHDKTKSPHVGVMAQDLEKVFPTAVSVDQTGYLRIRWDEMFYAVINAVKELDARLTEFTEQAKLYFDETMALKVTVREQQKTIQEQQKTIESLKMEIKTQNTEFEKRLEKIEKRQNAD